MKQRTLAFNVRLNLLLLKIRIWKKYVCWNICMLEETMDYSVIKTNWSYLKCNDLLHNLNVYKNPRKEHQIVGFWIIDQIAAPKILFLKYFEYIPLISANYKKLKMTKLLWRTFFSILNAQWIWMTTLK